jgi:hypothetical protein
MLLILQADLYFLFIVINYLFSLSVSPFNSRTDTAKRRYNVLQIALDRLSKENGG